MSEEMISREVWYVFRFVYDGSGDGEWLRTVWYGMARDEYGDVIRDAKQPCARREWALTESRSDAFRCKSVAWARRRAKIANAFKELLEDPDDEWRLEIERIEEAVTRSVERVFPKDAISRLGDLIDGGPAQSLSA